MIAFFATQLASCFVLGLAAWGAGSIVARRLECGSAVGLVALRTAAGLATLGFVLVALGMAGALNATASSLVALVAAGAGLVRLRDVRVAGAAGVRVTIALVAGMLPLFALCLYPPIAFDETLYHLPTVERFAETGSLPFIATLRFPVLPHLGEGISLVHGELERSALLGSLEPYEFSGDWTTNCQLRGGPVRDFNVITARTRASARVEVASGTRLHHLDCRGRVLLAYCVRGALVAEPSSRVHAFVVAGETLRVDGSDHVVVSGEDVDSAAILVEIGLA